MYGLWLINYDLNNCFNFLNERRQKNTLMKVDGEPTAAGEDWTGGRKGVARWAEIMNNGPLWPVFMRKFCIIARADFKTHTQSIPPTITGVHLGILKTIII